MLGRLGSWHPGELVDDQLTDSLSPQGSTNPGTVDRDGRWAFLIGHWARDKTSEQLGRMIRYNTNSCTTESL